MIYSIQNKYIKEIKITKQTKSCGEGDKQKRKSTILGMSPMGPELLVKVLCMAGVLWTNGRGPLYRPATADQQQKGLRWKKEDKNVIRSLKYPVSIK